MRIGRVGEIRWNIVRFLSDSEIWWDSMIFGENWQNAGDTVRYGDVWCDSVRYGEIWWDLGRYGEIL